MSEFRLNPATNEWVIIASERAKRPDAYHRHQSEKVDFSEWEEDCPFCLCNEHMAPPEIYRDPPSTPGTLDESRPWQVRIDPNLYPAFDTVALLEEKQRSGFFHSQGGMGLHDVVIEHPEHNRFTPLMKSEEIEHVLLAFRWRFLQIREDPRFRLITIFKNHGRAAGTSLVHPHSQIIATPMVPFFVSSLLDVAARYFGKFGRSVYQDMLEAELKDGRRILAESGHFVAYCPYGSRSPYEVWIQPKRDSSSFGAISSEEITDLSVVLGDVLGALYEGLGNPSFNYVIRTVPVAEEGKSYYVWHVEIVPRITTPAGFEMGSGVTINVTVPEESAVFLRGVMEGRRSRE